MAEQSLEDELKAENEQLKAAFKELEELLEEVRKGARQLHFGLLEYAKVENWVELGGGEGKVSWMWKGNGEPITKARYFLGLDQAEDQAES